MTRKRKSSHKKCKSLKRGLQFFFMVFARYGLPKIAAMLMLLCLFKTVQKRLNAGQKEQKRSVETH